MLLPQALTTSLLSYARSVYHEPLQSTCALHFSEASFPANATCYQKCTGECSIEMLQNVLMLVYSRHSCIS